MKKITLLMTCVFLFSMAFLSTAQERSIDELIQSYEINKNSPNGFTQFFTIEEMSRLNAYMKDQTTPEVINQNLNNGVLAYGWESLANGYGSYDISSPNDYTTISGGAPIGDDDFEGAGAIDPFYNTSGIAADTAGNLYSLDVLTGTYTPVGNTGLVDGGFTGLAYNPNDGVLYGVDGNNLYLVDPTTADATLIGSLGLPGNDANPTGIAIALAIDGSGMGYTYDIVLDLAYSIDLATGATTSLGSIDFDASFGQGMFYDQASDEVYLAAFNVVGNLSELRILDTTTGGTTLVGEISPGTLTQVAWSSVQNEPPLEFPLPYCGPLEFASGVEPLTNVEFAGIENRTDNAFGVTPAHEDFTSISGDVLAGESYEIALEGNTLGGFTNRFAVFIDWNQNDVFDAEEIFEITQTINGSDGDDGQQAVQTIDVPIDAVEGATRMRVKKIFGTDDYLDTCLGTSFGQAEDYTINVTTPVARAQVVHNSPDPSASVVDVYLGSDLLLDDFEFRTSTPFVDVPANQQITLSVAPGTSTDVSEALYSVDVTLVADETYVVVADGVLDPSQFDSSVNTIDFGLQVFGGAREAAVTAGNTDVLVHHGSPDAPTVDVVNQDGGAVIVDDISYPEFQGYLELPTDDYLIAVTTADNSTVVAEYEAFLSELGLTDQAITVLASGFLDPSANQDGPGFGLWVSLASGGPLVELSGPTARAQVIHNSPDPSASVVDVYLGDDLLLNDFEFRTSTPFVDVPANQQITLSVAPGTSTDVSEALYSVDVTLDFGETYLVVADGVLDPSQFDSSVNTIDFALQVFTGAREAAATAGNTDLLVHHGSPDAPTVDVVDQDGGGILVDDITYPEFQGYLELPTDDYFIDVTTADNSVKVAGYQAFLSTLGLDDAAITVLASGFLDPTANQNGPVFGLWVSLAGGGPLVELLDENAFPAPYCGPLEFTSNVEPITNVEFSDMANRSDAAIGGSPAHEDFSNIIVNVNPGESYDIILEGNTDLIPGFPLENRFAVFIDWNQDEVFSGAEEIYEITQTITDSNGEDGQQAIQTIDVPVDAAMGQTRMRVKKIFGTTDYLDPCVGATWGQAEDYTVSVGTLSNDDFSRVDFSFYPNPVRDVLSISTQSTVESLKVYNTLGQLMKETSPNSTNPQVNMSEFNSGVYLVSMEVEGRVQTFRVIKE